MTKKIVLVLTLLLLYFYYFISSAGINCSNDGGHFGLAKALYHDQTSQVEKYKDKYVRFPDYSLKDGQIYSDRLPGTAFLIIPYLAYSDLIIHISGYQGVDQEKFYVTVSLLLANIMGVVGALLLFLVCYRVFNFNFWLSWFTMIICAIATTMHLESTHLFSHSISLVFTTFSIYLVLRKLRENNWVKLLLLVSIIIGFSAVIELQNILFYLPILVYILLKLNLLKSKRLRELITPILTSLLLLIIALTPLILYNYLTFGEWMLKSNFYNPNFQENTGFIKSLSGNPFRGFDHLFTNLYNTEAYVNWFSGVKDNTPGILVASPIFIFSTFGFIPFYKKYKIEALLFGSIIAISVVVASFHTISLTRHIYTIQVLLFLPAIFCFEWIWNQKNKLRIPLIVALVTACVYSILRQIFIVQHYYGRDDLPLFSNSGNLNIFLIFHLPIVVIFILLTISRKMIKS